MPMWTYVLQKRSIPCTFYAKTDHLRTLNVSLFYISFHCVIVATFSQLPAGLVNHILHSKVKIEKIKQIFCYFVGNFTQFYWYLTIKL